MTRNGGRILLAVIASMTIMLPLNGSARANPVPRPGATAGVSSIGLGQPNTYAGHNFVPAGKLYSAASTVVVPSFTCPQFDPAPHHLRLGLKTNFSEPALLEIVCDDTVATITSTISAGSCQISHPEEVGDTLRFTIYDNGANVTVWHHNLTQGLSFPCVGPTLGGWSYVFFGAIPVVWAPTMNFGTVHFTRTHVDGQWLRRGSTTQYDKYVDGDFKIDTSKLTAHGTFRLDFVSFLD